MRRRPAPALALLLVLATALTTVLAGCGGGGGSSRGLARSDAAAVARATQERSAAYVASVATWRTRTLAPVVARVRAARFSELIVFGRVETPAEVGAQERRCASVKRARAGVAALRAPVLSGTGSARATRISTVTGQRTDAYRRAVGDALGQVATYCSYYTASLALSYQRRAQDAALTAVSVPFGPLCDDITGCVPLDTAARVPYAAAYKRLEVDSAAEDLALEAGVSRPCRLRALARYCALLAQQRSALLREQQRIYAVLSAPYVPGRLDAAYAARRVVLTRAFTQRDDLLAALFPALDVEAVDAELGNERRLLRVYERAAERAVVPPSPATVR